MKITPETKTLAAIFQTNSSVHYVIPVYQRNYSWKDEQIETLFDDIKNEDIGGLKSIFETGFKRHSEPRLPSTAQINH
ncbi:GmrSD restriction endonuclease domain-containing protein [Companilactobacillus crustorum]|uniref:GmrSD restriction endonuclease domain-containing protein n=1 Tax=Companilactobacillus crustorum TaxID=392416 RepID=UPI000957B1D8|nr:DUF262 domain-containing protein [Companilactobacillus crustorum]APU72553.1 hypothetical protein BI355_2262 [Companilactobacillus crustorum]